MKPEVYLRQLKMEDAMELTTIANNKKIWLNVRDRFPHPYHLKNALEWINHTLQKNPQENFAIICNGSIAGIVGVLPKEDVYRKSIEIGYFIGEPFWGKGIATVAVALLLEYVTKTFDVVRIYAEVFEHNKASMKVLENNGFTLESIRKRMVVKNDQVMDDYVWVKLVG
jgi:RimJ/RimL family protein N-acetyltransferase